MSGYTPRWLRQQRILRCAHGRAYPQKWLTGPFPLAYDFERHYRFTKPSPWPDVKAVMS